jgi:30S ribosome assembly GTPase
LTIDRERECAGCGIVLQSEDPTRFGYVPPPARTRELILCRRCYQIRHYGESETIQQTPAVYLQKLAAIASTDSFVVKVIDLFDFTGSWIPGMQRHIGKNPLLILANKIDLFPKSTKWRRVRAWIEQAVKEMGIQPVDVMMCSAAKGDGVAEAIKGIEQQREGRDVYVVGTTNTGKSTFMNRWIGQLDREAEGRITTSPYPGTTLDTICIPLADGRMIMDTPGIVKKDRFSEWISPEELKIALPTRTVHPKGYQLQEQQTLFLAGLVRFDFVQGPRQSFVIYVSNPLYIHRSKLERADAFQEKQRGKLLVPPADPSTLPTMVKHVFQLSGKVKEDIVISGLGWIAGGQAKAEVKVWAPQGIQVITRPSVI